MKTYHFDQLLTEEIEKNADHLIDINSTPITPMEEHIQKLKERIDHQESQSFKKVSPYKKMIGTVASIIILSLFLSFLWQTEPVQAFKFNIIKTFIEVKDDMISIKISKNSPQEEERIEEKDTIKQTLSFEEAREKIPFSFIQANYVPEGFKPQDVEWTRYAWGEHLVVQIFRAENGGFINIIEGYNLQGLESKGTMSVREDAQVKELKIDGKDILMICIEEDFTDALWYGDTASYEIAGNISEEEMIKMIKSIK